MAIIAALYLTVRLTLRPTPDPAKQPAITLGSPLMSPAAAGVPVDRRQRLGESVQAGGSIRI